MRAQLGDTARRLRAILVGSLGNLVEWYDFYVYSAFSLYFAPSFFPGDDPLAQMLSAAGVFALGFLMRPIGGALFGEIGDRYGRRRALTLSVLLMCLGSLIVAVTPTHATIGEAAPAILLFARLLQGLSLGGEYGSSATYLAEMAEPDRRGFYSSFQYVTLIGGQLLALLVLLALQSLVFSPQELRAYGWRIPFAIGAALALFAFVMRRDLDETRAFAAVTVYYTNLRAPGTPEHLGCA
ncbi:MFS transporter, partial [Methylosinus sp. 3S-1]|uniref:MFS transporter n=1 Tax=Methylosinus sp. 3S-1 TaxID=1849840 RepID=UPI0012EAB575